MLGLALHCMNEIMNLSWYFCGAVEMSLLGGKGRDEGMVFKTLCFSVAAISFFIKPKNFKQSNVEPVP